MTTFTILSSLLSLLTLLALSPSPSLANSHIPNVGRHLHHREYIDYYHSSPSLSKRKYKVKRDGNSTGLDPNPNLGGFTEVGNSGVSAQMMFLGTPNTVFILDKTENNSMLVTTPQGVTRPAWGTSYDLDSNTATPMAVSSNTFCAGGMTTGNGSWLVFGGNQPVTYGGTAVNDKVNNPTGADPYDDADGGTAIRLLNPCDDNSCPYEEGGAQLTMTSRRWYPTVEPMGDGSLVVFGGDENGGYVSTTAQNNPTYEFWPNNSQKYNINFLERTIPLNLFPLTWLMPSGKFFMQAYYSSILFDVNTGTETDLPNIPYSARTYPASAATVMLPLTPDNNYTPTILFCGGSNANFNVSTDGGANFNVTAVPADDSCVRINPDDPNPQYTDDDSLPEGRSMGNFIFFPDGTLWLGNGVGYGTAGYGNEHYSFGQSYGQDPIYDPVMYYPNNPSGSRFSRDGLQPSSQERMYHSTATLLPDSAILVSGSNPNADVETTKWATSYSVEKFYPTWYSNPRPEPTSDWPENLSYGGDMFNVTYTPSNSTADPSNTKVVVIRTGFSTHCMNFGQRYLELATSFTQDQSTGVVTMHVGQMPTNANVFQPGPAMIFLVEDGIPSIGEFITVGSGNIETQTINAATVLPQSAIIVDTPSPSASASASASSASATAGNANLHKSGGASAGLTLPGSLAMGALGLVGAWLVTI